MNLLDYKGFIFDLDGTLLNSEKIWESVDNDFFGKRGIELPEDYNKSINGLGLSDIAAYTITRFSLDETLDSVMDEWKSSAKKAYSDTVSLFPFADEVLSFLKNSDKSLAIATTNHSSLYIPALKRNGIYEYFKVIVDSDMTKCSKHKPDIYLLASRQLGLEPYECVVFEDIEIALNTARNAGFKTAGVCMSKKNIDMIKNISDIFITNYGNLLEDLKHKNNF